MTDTSHLRAVRSSYDTVADAYAHTVPAPDRLDPLSRRLLDAFAETVGDGPVADVGCGPGKVTAYLARAGVDAFGVDLSPRMAALARRAHPELAFAVGSMTALPVADAALAGILAYYSTHHTPPELLPTVYAEFRRALAPGGRLMIAGHVGEDGGEGERRHHTEAYGGLPVSYDSHFLPPGRILRLLEEAGFVVTARLTQEPAPGQRRRYGTFLAVSPGPLPGRPG
ncbi:methyltransferase domain-containing protein [Streptomyces sp. NPDC006339]|uniref:class I SAM-dependent methyltransferase n=1 Tax=Streptomyces sp. NPDC006339 TaxID=3156755 RepID=UPI0033A69FDB